MNSIVFRLSTRISALVMLSMLILIAYGISSSFDWTDEAWATSLILSGKEVSLEPWGYHYLLHPLLDFFGNKIIALRYLRLFSFVALGVLASFVTMKFLSLYVSKISFDQKLLLFVSGQIGTILAWTWMPRYFAYNELASIGSQVAALLVFTIFILRESEQKSIRNEIKFVISFALIGLILGLLFYAKFSTAIAVGGLVILVVIILTGKHHAMRLFYLLGGLFIGIWVPILFGLPFETYVESVIKSIFDENTRESFNHSSDIFGLYGENLITILVELILPILIMFFAVKLLAKIFYNKPNKELFEFICFSILLLTYLVSKVILLGFGPKSTGFYSLMLLIIGLSYLFFFRRIHKDQAHQKNRLQLLVLGVFLVLTPLAIAFGTNNSIYYHLSFESTLWGVFLGGAFVFITSKAEKDTQRSIVQLISISLIVSVAIVAYYQVMNIRNPYRSVSITQTDAYLNDSSPLAGIKLTQEEVRWGNWLDETASRFGLKDVPTISMKSPGALLLFNNSTYANPWLDPASDASYKSLEIACQENPPSNLVILQPVSEMNEESYKKLRTSLSSNCGLKFPQDFENIAQFNSFDSRFGTVVWKQK